MAHLLARLIHTKLARTSTFGFLWCGKAKLCSSFLGSIILQRKHRLGLYRKFSFLSKGVEGHLCFFVCHKSLSSILENLKSKCSARTERWSLCLWPRDTRVIYRAGTNSPADCVSCHPSCETKPTRREETVVRTCQRGQTTVKEAGQRSG